MTPFLKIVADDIFKKFNGDLADIAIVFPNKRAGLFFNEYIVQNSERPVWSPAYITISELFGRSSNAIIADPLLLVSKLYKEYRRHTRSDESIDRFYYWGELLIKDFDDIDKNLVDADKIFANLRDLRALGNGSDILDEEQRAAIEQFFTNFKPENNSELKERFLKIWDVIGAIYHDFRAALRKENIAYEGLLERDVLENSESLRLPYKKYVFVGFNALNRVEERLFDILHERGQALFYWDYDSEYTDSPFHDAGRFMRRNIKRYHNALPKEHFDNLSRGKKIRIVSADTESIQTRYIPGWIKEHLGEREIETAVVLCDETMLEPILHTIPDAVENINVTMGFPIAHTPVFNLVRMLVDLQTRGYAEEHATFAFENVREILSHPYVRQCSPKAGEIEKQITDTRAFFPDIRLLQSDDFLARIFTRRTDNSLWIASIGDIVFNIATSMGGTNNDTNDIYNELFREALLKVYTQTQRFTDLLERGEINMQQRTTGSLLLRSLASLSLPFHGEPVMGLQVMGLLETRNLDFRNIILLSANEGNLPKKSNDNSFIPYNLRRAFGLTLSEHRDSIYAYYFYRLMQRAEQATILYNRSPDSPTGGECSRYILQLQASGRHKIEKFHLQARQESASARRESAVAKTPEIMERMLRYFDFSRNGQAHTLSPTGINSYLKCPMKFFYRYVLGLREEEKICTELQYNDFGTIFHAAAENFYNTLTEDGKNRQIEKGDIQKYIDKDALLYQFVDDAFKEHFFKNDEKPQYDGEQYINREVIHRFLLRLLRMDAAHTPFTYIGSEQKISFPFNRACTADGRKIELHIGGSIDRMDKKDGVTEIIDYKTGGGNKKAPETIEEVFSGKGDHPEYIFQTMLYSIAAIESGVADKVSPSLIYIHKRASAGREDYVVRMNGAPVTDAGIFREEFLQNLQAVLNEIFDERTPFTRTDDDSRCEFCAYKAICGR